MVGEGIMIRNNPFLGLYKQMFQRVKECECWCLPKKKGRKGLQEVLSVKRNIQSLSEFFQSKML